MSPPDPTRRALLGGLLTVATAPAWVATAFAAEPPARQVELFATWHAARRAGRPVLAIVIPEGASDRGRVVGALLCEAEGRLLSLLAHYAPVCATAADLHLLGVVLPTSAWFAVIDTAAVPAGVVPIDGPAEAVTFPESIDRASHLLLRALADLAPAEAVAEGRERWVTSRLPGSYWATAGGCGLWVEEREVDEEWTVLCGMGSVPARAGRFLLFLDEA